MKKVLAVENRQKKFLDSLESEKLIIQQLASAEARVRAFAGKSAEGPGYLDHLANYISYYQSISGYDLFEGVLRDDEIFDWENATRADFQSSLMELFGVAEIEGDSFFRFFLEPEEFFREEIKEKISVSPEVNWHWLFDRLKESLPKEYYYRTNLRFDPSRAGGYYDSRKNEIVFGDHSVNISTILGFVHEFGHSVFLVANDDANSLRLLAANESYAELWAAKLLHFSFARQIFRAEADFATVEKYMAFRDLVSFRFYLFALAMDRQIGAITSPEDYRERSRALSKRFLCAENFPAILAAMPQMRIPGYLQAYLAIPFLKAFYGPSIDRPNVVDELLRLGPVVQEDAAEENFPRTFRQAVSGYLK